MAAEFYGYFDSTTGDERSYNADQFAAAFRTLSRDGTADKQDSLRVEPAGDSMAVVVRPGACIIDGYLFVLTDDGGAAKRLSLAVSGTSPRIDLVVARLDLTTAASGRKISLEVKQGTPGASPEPPELTSTATMKEIPLARVTISASATTIAADNIEDARVSLGAREVVAHTHPAYDYGEATSAKSGLLSASDKAYLDKLSATVTVTDDGISLGGKYIDNAVFR